jgi:hypothetical protein
MHGPGSHVQSGGGAAWLAWELWGSTQGTEQQWPGSPASSGNIEGEHEGTSVAVTVRSSKEAASNFSMEQRQANTPASSARSEHVGWNNPTQTHPRGPAQHAAPPPYDVLQLEGAMSTPPSSLRPGQAHTPGHTPGSAMNSLHPLSGAASATPSSEGPEVEVEVDEHATFNVSVANDEPQSTMTAAHTPRDAMVYASGRSTAFNGSSRRSRDRMRHDAARGSANLPAMRRIAIAAALVTGGCGSPAPPPRAPTETTATTPAAPAESAWGKFHSNRFNLSVPLPDGKKWKIDDHTRPSLYAVNDASTSKLWLAITNEDELVNRQRCEAKARNLGWIPTESKLSTVEDEVTVGPEAYDSRVWVVLDAGRPGGAIDGHVYLFGGFLRRCLLVHYMTTVASVKEEDVLSSRLALASARVVKGIAIDPPRTTDDAVVPKDKPEIKR